MQNYSRSQSPPNPPVPVKVEVTIQDIAELSVLSNSFTADLWFSAIWHDPRLAFSHLDPCRKNLSFDATFENLLWSPNVCLVNTKYTRIHSSPKPNVLLMLLQNGTVWLNYRVRAEAPCEYNLADFPMDTVQCSLVFESYSYNTATVVIDWMPQAITLVTKEFTAADYVLSDINYFKHTEYYKAGEWYRLTLEIGFRRNYGFYIIEIYATMYINVFLSWIAFCISLKALPARVILSVNTLMSLCLQFGNIISSLPPVSYVKSIDLFMFTCIAYIFGSLLEMAFIAYQDKKMLMRSLRFNDGLSALLGLGCFDSFKSAARHSVAYDLESPDQSTLDADFHHFQEYMSRNTVKRKMTRIEYLDRGTRIDRISFVLFPLTFFVFNACYWTYYLSK
ncbi:neurotransmitter-gated ion-channel ligand binding domain-containing protein [Ditylenchus destructor]|uniref:Neurotransmitter-gated ion-channel ligand binding domain-containing protein n=1 Tax=Ditylenchus destructor TaxID=166010 RepID=A0AAD4NBJ7_9BILA|nr:neurotransmitter-gated ion-channel ligand binding domain-containing protein [Ditylenchus destructor]